MTTERPDPLDALRQAWQQEATPMPEFELERQDAQTQEVVRNLQRAWQIDLAAPKGGDLALHAIEQRLQDNGVLTPVRARKMRRIAACAALAMVALGVWGYSRFNRSAPSEESQTYVAENDQDFPTDQVLPEKHPSTKERPTVTEWSLRPDGFEKQAGAVRLVLVEPKRMTESHP